MVLVFILAGCNLPGKTNGGVTATQTATPPGAIPSTGKDALPNFDHIILIVLENKGYSAALDGKTMPHLKDIAQKNVLLANYYGISHPSLPNYLSLVSGSAQGVTSDCTNCFVDQPNLADEIEKSGRTWKAYEESMPSPCFIGDANPYAQKHDPFIYFDSIRKDPKRCANIVPLTQLDTDLTGSQLPNFAFIMPDLCDSGHNCQPSVADKWLNQMVKKLQDSTALGNNYLIAITFDEAADSDRSACCGLSQGGGRVATILISPSAKPGAYHDIPYSHYSLLKTFLRAWNLPDLGATGQAAIVPIGAPWGVDTLAGAAAGSVTSGVSRHQGNLASGNVTITGRKAVLTMGCSTTAFPSGGSLKVCFTGPAEGSSVSGNVQIKVNEAVNGANAKIQQTIFMLDKKYLLTDFSPSMTFDLPTTNYADGTHLLTAQVMLTNKSLGDLAGLDLTFKNGGASPASVPQFQPFSSPASTPFTVAAVGDGAGGGPNESKVTQLIQSLNPNLLLYLGDVYERGSQAEFSNWYGGPSSYYGQFRSITQPTIGNHEYGSDNGANYFNYWGNIPPFYSFNAGGWHFVSLNSNGSKTPIAAGSKQYRWLQQDLAANKQPCTLVYYHHPLFNIGPEGSNGGMTDIWKLLALDKVTIVLNGHDHDYQRWTPLDGSGNPDPHGVTEFVVGTGGHGLQNFIKTDPRVVYSNDTPPDAFGVLKLTLGSNKADFEFMNIAHAVIDSGSVQCEAGQ